MRRPTADEFVTLPWYNWDARPETVPLSEEEAETALFWRKVISSAPRISSKSRPPGSTNPSANRTGCSASSPPSQCRSSQRAETLLHRLIDGVTRIPPTKRDLGPRRSNDMTARPPRRSKRRIARHSARHDLVARPLHPLRIVTVKRLDNPALSLQHHQFQVLQRTLKQLRLRPRQPPQIRGGNAQLPRRRRDVPEMPLQHSLNLRRRKIFTTRRNFHP
jgi:hypothetical protein